MWGSFKDKFVFGEKVDKEEQDKPETRNTLYVKKVGGNDDYMVSHLALGGYTEYTKGSNGCWTSDGVSSVRTTTNVSQTKVKSSILIPKMEEDTLIANARCKKSDIKKYTETSGDSVMKIAIMNHVILRFAQLDCILGKNTDVKAIIGGGTVDENYNFKIGGELKPTLGRGLAIDQWVGYDSTKGKKHGNDVAAEIENLWKNLEIKYNKDDGKKRLFIGVVGFNHNLKDGFKSSRDKETNDFGIDNLDPSNKLIHVWGANITNFDKSNIGGAGQADSMQYYSTRQATNPAGAFGIITTPTGAKQDDGSDIAESNEKLIKIFFTDDETGGSKPRNRTRSKKRRNSRKSN